MEALARVTSGPVQRAGRRSCPPGRTSSRRDGARLHRCDRATEDWADDRKVLARINRLIRKAARDPATGTGEPERLSGDLSGCWSRRIDHEHRLVYTVEGDQLVVLQARCHYR
jgi:toxin YoeB